MKNYLAFSIFEHNFTGMKKLILAIISFVLITGTVSAQDTYYSVFSYQYFIPKVTINDRSISLQKSLFPREYDSRAVGEDIQWVRENDSTMAEFWNQKGDTILHILTELSGIEWTEKEFEIYLLRYYPTIGSANPLILPLGGYNDGSVIEAAPDFNKLRLLLIYQLSKRMLLQVYQPSDTAKPPIASHPLMRQTPYRFDNLAMLLAVTASYTILGVDTTSNVIQSLFWKQKFPGLKIFEEYFDKDWIITPEKTLSDWIMDEPYYSQLVTVTRTPKIITPETGEEKKFIEGLPLKGKFGFSVKLNDANQLEVSKIDIYRLAYACGLKTGDIIKRVDGRIVHNQKQIIEQLLDRLDKGGSVMEIVREGQAMEVIIQPMNIDYYSDEYYLENQPDSLLYDSTAVDTSGYK